MTNILVLYATDTGNTRRMAELVAGGASRHPECAVKIKSVAEALPGDLAWCDGIAVGCPTHYGSVSWRMKKWWDDLPPDLWGTIDGKVGCAFSSSGGWGGGAELACLALLTILINYGFLVFGVTDYVEKRLTLHYGAALAGEPRSGGEIEACDLLGCRLAETAAKRATIKTGNYFGGNQ